MKAWEESLSTARYLSSPHDGRRPPREHLKSAIGDAYYAVFHRLQSMCADCFIGEEDDPNTPKKGLACAASFAQTWHDADRSPHQV